VLGLDSNHRMNTPGQEGCWTWRFTWDMVGPQAARLLGRIGAACGRAPLAKLELPVAV
jgi:4-alpha-glucanotransferase